MSSEPIFYGIGTVSLTWAIWILFVRPIVTLYRNRPRNLPSPIDEQIAARPGLSPGELLPLRDEVIQGVRTYDIVWEGGRPYLKGVMGVRWETRRLKAQCGVDPNRDHEVREFVCERHLASANTDCGCGIYAYSIPDDRNAALLQPFHITVPGQVFARVVLYGVVWPHTKGYRATECRIEELSYLAVQGIPGPYELELCEAISKQYEVPCTALLGPTTPPADVWERGAYLGSGYTAGKTAGPSYYSPWES